LDYLKQMSAPNTFISDNNVNTWNENNLYEHEFPVSVNN
jgi:hypothetical protein